MQDETKNAKRENESTHTLSEDIYSTQDSLLGGKYPFVSIYTQESVSCGKNNNSQILR